MDKVIKLDIDFESTKHIRSEYQNGLLHGKTNEIIADAVRKVSIRPSGRVNTFNIDIIDEFGNNVMATKKMEMSDSMGHMSFLVGIDGDSDYAMNIIHTSRQKEITACILKLMDRNIFIEYVVDGEKGVNIRECNLFEK